MTRVCVCALPIEAGLGLEQDEANQHFLQRVKRRECVCVQLSTIEQLCRVHNIRVQKNKTARSNDFYTVASGPRQRDHHSRRADAAVASCSLDRTAFCCGETLKLKSVIDNQGEEGVKLKVRLLQLCEFFVERGVLGVTKEVQHLVLEYKGEPVPFRDYQDTCASLRIPTVPTTLVGVCRLVQIYYTLTACLEFEKSGDDLHINFPITIGTVPFRIPNSNLQPHIGYDVAIDHVEGGIYIGPEFLLGEVYDGCNVSDNEYRDLAPLYRPVYLTVVRSSQQISARAAGRTNRKKSSCEVEIAEIHRK